MGSSPSFIPQAPDNNEAAIALLIAQQQGNADLFNQKLKSDYALQQLRGGIQSNLFKAGSDAQVALQQTQGGIEDAYLQNLLKGQLGMLQTQGDIQLGQIDARNKIQSSLLDTQNQQLLREAKISPAMERFDANAAAEDAKRFAIGNIQRQREAESIFNPEAADMRRDLAAELGRITSDDYDKGWMNELVRSGIVRNLQSGLGAGTIGEAAFADQSLEQKRKRDMEKFLLKEQYLKSIPQIETINPQQLVASERQVSQQNLNRLNDWQQGILQAARGIGQTAGQLGLANIADTTQRQDRNLANLFDVQSRNYGTLGNMQFTNNERVRENVLGGLNALGQTQMGEANALSGISNSNLQSISDFLNKTMGTAQSINQANRQEWRDYQNTLAQISAQDAASNNSLLGAGIGAGGSIGGAALGSMLMPGVGTGVGATTGAAVTKPGFLRGLFS